MLSKLRKPNRQDQPPVDPATRLLIRLMSRLVASVDPFETPPVVKYATSFLRPGVEGAGEAEQLWPDPEN